MPPFPSFFWKMQKLLPEVYEGLDNLCVKGMFYVSESYNVKLT